MLHKLDARVWCACADYFPFRFARTVRAFFQHCSYRSGLRSYTAACSSSSEINTTTRSVSARILRANAKTSWAYLLGPTAAYNTTTTRGVTYVLRQCVCAYEYMFICKATVSGGCGGHHRRRRHIWRCVRIRVFDDVVKHRKACIQLAVC